VAAAGKLDMPVDNFFFGADLQSLPLLRRDRLRNSADSPCVDHGFARQFVIGAPFFEHLGRRTGGAEKPSVQCFDQGERLDPREQSVRPRRDGPPKGGVGGNRGGAKVQGHYCSDPATAHAGVSIRQFAGRWQTNTEIVIARTP
jgi:hypothetical protein